MTWLQLQARDCIEALNAMPEQSVDCIITDPAYESLEKHRAKGTTTRLVNSWFPIFPNDRFEALFLAMWRVLKSDAHLYVFCDQETAFEVVSPVARRCEFKQWNALVWDKRRSPRDLGMGYHYRHCYEFVLFFDKNGNGRPLAERSMGNLLAAPKVVGGYPTEKPVELLRALVLQSTDPGQVVVDPFMGSGSTGIAALENKRNFIGIDVVPQVVADARSTLYAQFRYGEVKEVDTPPRPALELQPT